MKVSDMEARGSKTLVAGEPRREPSWLVWTLLKICRIVILTVLWSGLGMGVGLLCGILGLVTMGAITHRTPDMSLAYRHVSVPLAIGCGSCALVWNLVRAIQAAGTKRKRKSH